MYKNRMNHPVPGVFALLVAALCGGTLRANDDQFPPSKLATVSGAKARAAAYYAAEDCGTCHSTQYEAWQGSIHSRAHHDGIYRAFADLARAEGGDDLYVFCSSCHAPGAVAAGEIPPQEGSTHTFLTDEGVTCEACHSAQDVRAVHLGAGANASVVLDDSEVRYGGIEDPAPSDAHASAYSPLHRTSRLCSACHTLIHPYNGLVIENTYEEWKGSAYAAAGIQCQDCHMRTVAQAVSTAAAMQPFPVPGQACDDGPERPDVRHHAFVGANVNQELTGGRADHAAEAERRLQNAARMTLRLPAEARPGETAEIGVEVTNHSAGHSIPSSITELRQVWIDLHVTDAAGRTIFRSGALREDGSVDPKAAMFHTVLADKDGNVTHRPWTAERKIYERLIGPKATEQERYPVQIPSDVKGPLSVQATLRYRSAPQEVMDELFGKGRFPIRIVDMSAASGQLSVP